MATLTVRKLDDDLVRRLRIRAAEHGRSAEAEHREILRVSLAGTGPARDDVVGEEERARRREAVKQLKAFRDSVADRGSATVAELLHETRTARMEQLAPDRTLASDKTGGQD